MIYLLVLTLGLCAVYCSLLILFPAFFGKKSIGLSQTSLSSILIIVVSAFLAYIVSALIPDAAWGNRVQHAVGGGVVAFLVCFCATGDSGVRMSRFQFVALSVLIVTALGVANEMFEYVLQTFGIALFAETPEDTWLDLVSNTVGIVVAAAIFTPFINRRAR